MVGTGRALGGGTRPPPYCVIDIFDPTELRARAEVMPTWQR
ncbi:hypothetical protein ACIRL2_41625 [Embleya sp. NPDC127516]